MVLQKSGHRISSTVDAPCAGAWTVANAISVGRVVMLAIGAGMLASGQRGALPVLICTMSVVLDAVDGWAARRLGQCSLVGEYLDPLVDKLSIAVALWLVAIGLDLPLAWALAGAIVLRDVVVTAMRWRLWRRGMRLVPDGVAKLKTGALFVTTMTVLAFLYWFDVEVSLVKGPIVVLMFAMLVLTGYSAVRYLVAISAAVPRGSRQLGESS